MDDVSSNDSSLSMSPSTPKKEWEQRFKSYQMQRNERMDDSSADSSSNRYDLPDISVKSNPSSLPHNYALASRNPLASSSSTAAGARGLSPKKIVVPPPMLVPNKVFNTTSTKSLDNSQKNSYVWTSEGEKSDHLPISSPSNTARLPHQFAKSIQVDYDDDDDEDDEDDEDGANDQHKDTSTRGGNLFASMFKKKNQKNKDNDQTKEVKKEKKSRLLRKKTPKELGALSEAKRRTKSYDCLLDTSMRGGDGSRRSRGPGRTSSDGKSLSLKPHNLPPNKYGPVGTVIGPDGILRHIETKMDPKKEKKMLFTEIRNDAMTKDSATAFLGEEKSTHHGKNFGKKG